MITQHEQLDTAITNVGNRYVATMLIAKRIRQLNHGARACVERQDGENHFSIAVREIAEGHITLDLTTTSPVATTPEAPGSNGAPGATPASPNPASQK